LVGSFGQSGERQHSENKNVNKIHEAEESGKTCGGENQSNDIEATTAHDFRPKFIVMFHIWL
jgi:hypothetical protein